MMNIHKITMIAVLMAMAIAVSVLESFIPSIIIPGLRLGLANIFILLVLYEFGLLEALFINVGRVFIASLVRGTIFQMGFFMSITGAMLSMIVMWLLVFFFKKLSPVAVSVVGALFHIAGQFVIATIFLESPYIWYYAPVLALISVGTGIIVGLMVVAIKRTKIIENYKNKYQM